MTAIGPTEALGARQSGHEHGPPQDAGRLLPTAREIRAEQHGYQEPDVTAYEWGRRSDAATSPPNGL